MSSKGEEPLALANRFPMDPAVEALRTMRASLQFALNGDRNNVVMLAGPLPGIGKSFLSANLSTLLAAGGKRVLLIDGDLRRGHLNQYFGLPRGAGLADLVAGNRSLEDTVHKEVLPNLDVLQCGEYPRDPAELLLSANFRATDSRRVGAIRHRAARCASDPGRLRYGNDGARRRLDLPGRAFRRYACRRDLGIGQASRANRLEGEGIC